MIYTSIDNPKIKEIKKLQVKKHRDENGLFLVEGEHLVLEAYQAGYLKTLILEENQNLKLEVDTLYVSNNVLKYISELETPQGIMGICIKKQDNENIGNHILMLEDIQDPGNLGTIIRSAVAFNIDTIIMSNNTVDLYNSKVIRGSQGLLFHINIINRDLLTFLPSLKNNGYKILGTRVTDGKSLKKIEKCDKFVIIMGNEGKGLSQDLQNLCDEFIYIDMNKSCESLNVGVATSIILYELNNK
jgi:TrmH family RNA methyltransferase